MSNARLSIPITMLLNSLGIVRSVEKDEDKQYVDMIRNMTIEYINKAQAIIVIAVAMNNDVDNQVIESL